MLRRAIVSREEVLPADRFRSLLQAFLAREVRVPLREHVSHFGDRHDTFYNPRSMPSYQELEHLSIPKQAQLLLRSASRFAQTGSFNIYNVSMPPWGLASDFPVEERQQTR
jgi:hypothetical protein